MDKNNVIVDHIFPTPICRISVPKHFISVIPYLESFPHYQNINDNSLYGSRSKDSYILNHKDLIEFKNYLHSQISIYAIQLLNLSDVPYKITQSWISYKHPNESHHIHTHPNSIISGVFFWEKFSALTPNITFKKPQSHAVWSLHPQQDHQSPKNPYFIDSASFTPKPGTLILFPSYIPHEVSINTSSKVRKSLAFNSIPIILGNETELTELKF